MNKTKFRMTTPLVKILLSLLRYFSLAIVVTTILGGCHGGGSGGGSSASGQNVISGTAAEGEPLANATVTIKDSTGAISTTTTDANGNYSFDVSGKRFPLMLEVQPNIPGAAPLFSSALTSGTVNLNPLTSLQVYEALGGNTPSLTFLSGNFSQIGNSTLAYGKTTVISNLAPQLIANGLVPESTDPVTTPMVANGTGMDAVLDHNSVAIMGHNASLSDSAGNCIPFAAPNEMTLAVDGIDPSNLPAFLGISSWSISIPFLGERAGSNLSGDFGNAGYLIGYLKSTCVAGIDQRRPFSPNVTNPPKFLSNVPWTRDPTPAYTSKAVAQLILQLKLAAQENKTAIANGGTPGPINIITHSWGGIIAYLALTKIANSPDPTENTIQVANLITMGTPVECLSGYCPNEYLPIPVGKATQNNAPSESYLPIQKPANVKNWTNYWGKDDVLSARINAAGVMNRYVDCAGNLYGNISTDPKPLPCVISAADWATFDAALASWNLAASWASLQHIASEIGSNHLAYFRSATEDISATLVDVRSLVSSSRADAASAQATTPPTTGAAALPPSNFSVSTGAPFCGTSSLATPAVNLTWSAAQGAAYYRVFRNGRAIGVNLNASQRSFANKLGLVAGKSYGYKVEAINASGASWSNELQVPIPTGVCGSSHPVPGHTETPLIFSDLTSASLSTSKPSYQLTLTATGDNFNNLTKIRFDWSGPTVGTKTWYKSDKDWGTKVVVSSDGSSMTLAPVVTLAGDPPGLTTWTVTLTDTSGATATKSFTVNYTPPSTAPGDFAMSANPSCSTTSTASPAVMLSWTASSGAVSYDVYRNGALLQSDIAGTRFNNNSNVAAGQTYTYSVFANNAFGTTQSNALNVTVPPAICSINVPTMPTSLSPGSTSSPGTMMDSASVPLSWSDSGGAALYIGGITDIASGSNVAAINTSGTYSTATLSLGKQYRWWVEACNSSGCSRSSRSYYFQTPIASTCTTTFNTSSEAIDSSGGQRQVILTMSEPSCSWAATSNQAWVHGIIPSSGSSGATLTYTVDPNTSAQSRSAIITAGQAQLTVSQTGSSTACTFALGEITKSVPADGGTFLEGLIASNQSCSWTAHSNTGLIANLSPTSGVGDANISYAVAANTSSTPRTGTVTIAGKTLTVTEQGVAGTPTGAITANPTSVPAGGQTTLNWSTSNTTSCTAYHGWSGSVPTSGSRTVTVQSAAGTENFGLNCTGLDGSTFGTGVNVTVTNGPGVTISDNPTSIDEGQASTLSWSSTNTTSCTASGGWSGSEPTSGSTTVSPRSTTVYELTCSGTNGTSASDSATVNVTPEPSPTGAITTNPTSVPAGGQTTLNWSTSNTTSCTAYHGWSGSVPTSGSRTVTVQSTAGTENFGLNCTGLDGSTFGTGVNVTVTAPQSSPPVTI